MFYNYSPSCYECAFYVIEIVADTFLDRFPKCYLNVISHIHTFYPHPPPSSYPQVNRTGRTVNESTYYNHEPKSRFEKFIEASFFSINMVKQKKKIIVLEKYF